MRQRPTGTVPASASSAASSPLRGPCIATCGGDGRFASSRASRRLHLGLIVVSVLLASAAPFADDWPEYRGIGRRGVWKETGIIDRIPDGGVKVLWRAPVKAGYSGPVVARGRVVVTDFVPAVGPRGSERVLCFDEK